MEWTRKFAGQEDGVDRKFAGQEADPVPALPQIDVDCINWLSKLKRDRVHLPDLRIGQFEFEPLGGANPRGADAEQLLVDHN
jgi:hypothetical protein